MTYEQLLERFLDWARTQPEIRGAIVVGSQARTDRPADAWSDLDLIVLTDDADRFLSRTAWIERIGTYWFTFLEPTAMGEGMERRVLFEGGLDVDFVPVRNEAVRQMAVEGVPPEVADLFQRGYRFALDKDGVAALFSKAVAVPLTAEPPTPAEFLNVYHDFWYHVVWTVKKLRRGELWTAKLCLDGYMKWRLLRMIEWHARGMHGWDYDTWHSGRFLEKWADPRAVDGLRWAFAHYDVADLKRALLATMDLFRWIAAETAVQLQYDYPATADERVTAWVATCLGQQANSAMQDVPAAHTRRL